MSAGGVWLDGPAAAVVAEWLRLALTDAANRGERLSSADQQALALVLRAAREHREGRGAASGLSAPIPDVSQQSWISTAEAAQKLGIHERSLRKAIARGAVEAQRVGGQWVLEERALAAYWPRLRSREEPAHANNHRAQHDRGDAGHLAETDRP